MSAARARIFACILALLQLAAPRCFAPPPLITGDVPTADQGRFELYAGFRYQDTGTIAPRFRTRNSSTASPGAGKSAWKATIFHARASKVSMT